jgi:hypothetical protein
MSKQTFYTGFALICTWLGRESSWAWISPRPTSTSCIWPRNCSKRQRVGLFGGQKLLES